MKEMDILLGWVFKEWKVRKGASKLLRLDPTGILQIGYLESSSIHCEDKEAFRKGMTTTDEHFDTYQATENQLEGDISQLLYSLRWGNSKARVETWEEKEIISVKIGKGGSNR